jgi:hypothetical protein
LIKLVGLFEMERGRCHAPVVLEPLTRAPMQVAPLVGAHLDSSILIGQGRF